MSCSSCSGGRTSAKSSFSSPGTASYSSGSDDRTSPLLSVPRFCVHCFSFWIFVIIAGVLYLFLRKKA
jgi:hypothetical protein